MNKDVYSNSELTELKNRINKEMLRRGSYKWWGPLSQPKVGEDTRSPDSIPHDKTSIPVTDQTYTINNPSVGSIAPTRNIVYPNQGENPAGQNPDGQTPTTSAARFDLDEIKNFLVGISKIRDINLFYSQDEQEFLAFRDLGDVRKLVSEIESDRLNKPTTHPFKVDPNAPDRITVIKDGKTWTEPNPNKNIPYEKIGDKYYMLSGEYDGEEGIPSETNYYDDYGAEPGNGNYHSLNPYVSANVDRTGYDFDNDRNKIPVGKMEGGKSSSRFGMTPRNPRQGDSYQPRVAYQGVPSTCNIACSGVCSLTCDSQCGESCTTTCFGRCGNACVSTCGNVCTGCSSLCYTSCQSKCENNSGMACVKAGATTLSIAARGGKDGTPAYNEMKIGAPYACTQCSFSCQFYPNKKTTCWDNGCMGMCFTSCMHSCSTSCFGGCVDNPSENKGDFKTGIGRGCSSGCTVNCVGVCRGTCVGTCSSGCWNSCIQSCKDNCEWECSTSCGSGCMQGCMSGCKDQCTSCENVCTSASGAKTTCNNGCVASCMHGCDKNCIANSCTAMCGSEGSNACDANCRMSCMSSSCTAQCSEQCASYCTSCVNGCDMACGACFKAGTLIETINGPVPIEEIQIGDLVLTQSGKYHKVYNTMKRSPGIKDLLVVKGVGTFDIYTTIDHPFWVKKYSKLGRRDKEFGTSQIYDDPTWVEAKDISSRDKLCLYTPPIGHVSVNPGIAYMVGRWLGDGCRTDSISNINNKAYPRFTICCGKHERVDFERKLRQAAIYTTRHEGETTFVYRIPGKLTKHTADYNNYELVELLKKCGKTAIGKYIPQEVYNWDEPSLSYLIQGYIDADGHISRLTSQFMMTSINKKLLYQFATLLRMLDRNPSCTERKLLSDIGYIIGRKVHIHKSYMIRSQYDEYTRFYSFHDHSKNITWATFRSKHSPSEKYDVYNLSVEEDPTYYADGVLVHNCSSLCNTGCEAACNITCTAHCQHSCDLNCVKSCTEACGACFKAGTMIQTIDGLVPIEEIQIGDKVLTQSGKYHKIIKTMKRRCDNNLIEVHGVGAPTIYTTKDHPFWVKKYIGLLRKNGKSIQLYSDPEWVKAKDLKPRDKWCLYSRPVGNIHIDPGVAYMVGRWLGDGWRTDEISNINKKSYPRFSICCGKHERADFEKKLKECEIFTTHRESETVHDYRIPSKVTKHTAGYNNHKLVSILLKCGQRAHGKFIPEEIFEWDRESLILLIQGYLDADGYSPISKYRIFSATSVSKKLLIGISTILRMLGINPGWNIRNNSITTILGRTVHIRTSYSIHFRTDTNRKFSFKDDDSEYIWSTVMKTKTPTELYDVYNLTVSEDPSYFADGVLVHNCSNLCTSCVGMCIGECSVKCTNNCSLCANNCGHWCDTQCSQNCFANCDNSCMQTCTNSCIGTVTSNTKQSLAGPERPPTAHGYKTPHPSNREEERESFKIIHDIDQITTDRIIRDWKERLKKKSPYSTVPDTKICIKVKSNDNIKVIFTDFDPIPYNIYYSTVTGGVFNIDEKTGTILINHKALEEWAKSGYKKVVKNVNQKDGEDVSIVAVVLHCKDTNLTVNDVSYLRPLGYDFYTPYHTRNGDIICILQYLINYMEYDKNKHLDDQHITYPKRL